MTFKKTEESIEDTIYNLVAAISPLDHLEQKHIKDTLAWIQSATTIFRIKKPDVPDKHLACYFCLLDQKAKKILLVNHINSGLWLPPGGHVDINEHPRETVRRECMEELHISASFLVEDPVFITQTNTVGKTSGHVDVNLWYVLEGSSNSSFDLETDEFNSTRWFSISEITDLKTDAYMDRFLGKMQSYIIKSAVKLHEFID